MECEPAERLEVEKVALPPLNTAEPICVPPSRNLTVPLAVDGETVAVREII